MKFKVRKVKIVWDKKLKGKKGYVANNINELAEIVEGKCCSDIVTVQQSQHDAFPFQDDVGYEYRFFYPVRGVTMFEAEAEEYAKRKMKVWHKNDLPPHNVQVLDEYDCVVTYNHFTKTWRKANGRKTTPKVWRFRDKEIKEEGVNYD